MKSQNADVDVSNRKLASANSNFTAKNGEIAMQNRDARVSDPNVTDV